MEQFLGRISRPAGWIAGLMGVVAVWAVLFYAQVEKIQGPIQKLMYLHVSAATINYVAVAACAFAGGMFLWKGQARWDRVGRCSAELALLLAAVVLITGPLWGRPVWGTFWVWDARLTFTLLLFLILLAYFVVRAMVPGERGARFASIVGIVALIDIPFIKIATEKFRTLHPSGVVKGGLTLEMGVTLTWWMLTVLVFFVYLLGRRVEIARLADRVSALRGSLEADA